MSAKCNTLEPLAARRCRWTIAPMRPRMEAREKPQPAGTIWFSRRDRLRARAAARPGEVGMLYRLSGPERCTERTWAGPCAEPVYESGLCVSHWSDKKGVLP